MGIAATRFSYYDNPAIPTYLLNNFNGELTKVSDLEMHVDYGSGGVSHWTQLSGNGTTTDVLDMGTSFQATNSIAPYPLSTTWQDTTSPAANAAFFHGDVGSCYNKIANSIPSAGFLTDRLALLRSVTITPPTTPGQWAYRRTHLPCDGDARQRMCRPDHRKRQTAPWWPPPLSVRRPGAYGSAQSVTISTTTGGATMRYTTDGSDTERVGRHGVQQPGQYRCLLHAASHRL